MSGLTRRLVWLITGAGVLTLLTGCFSPLAPSPGLTFSTKPAFAVVVRAPGAPTTTSTRGGQIDVLSLGHVTLVSGWVSHPNASLTVITDVPSRVSDRLRYVNRGAAKVVGQPPEADLGFQFLLTANSGSVKRVCIIARTPTIPAAVLTGSDPMWCAVA